MARRTRHPGLREMYERTLPEVFGYLLHRCGDRSLAEELCSETYLAAVGRIRSAGPDAVTVMWLKAVAHNKLVDHWRRAQRSDQRQRRLESSFHEAAAPPDDVIVDQAVVLDALARLPLEQRLALTFRYLDQLDIRDVADRLNRSIAATDSLLARARRALARQLEETLR